MLDMLKLKQINRRVSSILTCLFSLYLLVFWFLTQIERHKDLPQNKSNVLGNQRKAANYKTYNFCNLL